MDFALLRGPSHREHRAAVSAQVFPQARRGAFRAGRPGPHLQGLPRPDVSLVPSDGRTGTRWTEAGRTRPADSAGPPRGPAGGDAPHAGAWGPGVPWGASARGNASFLTPGGAVSATLAPCLLAVGPACPSLRSPLPPWPVPGRGHGPSQDETVLEATTRPSMWPAGLGSARDAGGQQGWEPSGRTGPEGPHLTAQAHGAPPSGARPLLPSPGHKPSSQGCWLQRGNSTLIFHCFYRKVRCQKGKIETGTAFPHPPAPPGIVTLFAEPPGRPGDTGPGPPPVPLPWLRKEALPSLSLDQKQEQRWGPACPQPPLRHKATALWTRG